MLGLDFRVGRSGLKVERADGSRAGPPQDVEVNHGGLDAGVAHQVLDRPDVGAVLK